MSENYGRLPNESVFNQQEGDRRSSGSNGRRRRSRENSQYGRISPSSVLARLSKDSHRQSNDSDDEKMNSFMNSFKSDMNVKKHGGPKLRTQMVQKSASMHRIEPQVPIGSNVNSNAGRLRTPPVVRSRSFTAGQARPSNSQYAPMPQRARPLPAHPRQSSPIVQQNNNYMNNSVDPSLARAMNRPLPSLEPRRSAPLPPTRKIPPSPMRKAPTTSVKRTAANRTPLSQMVTTARDSIELVWSEQNSDESEDDCDDVALPPQASLRSQYDALLESTQRTPVHKLKSGLRPRASSAPVTNRTSKHDVSKLTLRGFDPQSGMPVLVAAENKNE